MLDIFARMGTRRIIGTSTMMVKQKQNIWVVSAILLLMTGCSGSSERLVDRVLPYWSVPAQQGEGPGMRPVARAIDPDAPWPNLASVPDRPLVDWQTRFDDTSAGLVGDLNQATAIQQGSATVPDSPPMPNDPSVPALPVLSAVPQFDVNKPLPPVAAALRKPVPVPALPPMGLGRKPLAPVEDNKTDRKPFDTMPPPPKLQEIAPKLESDNSVRDAESAKKLTDDVVNNTILRIDFSVGQQALNANQQAALEKLADHAKASRKRVRIQLYTPTELGPVVDLAMARGADITATIVRYGVNRHLVVLAPPAQSDDVTKSQTAFVTILP
jgi:PBP1b-binding outer membrane lipoprotein LpoB